MESEFRWVHIESKQELKGFYQFVLPKIIAAARGCGYAIGLHGSMERDLDLIAVPWIDDFSTKDELAAAINIAACGIKSQSYEWERKPNGRMATAFPICWTWHSEPMILSNGHIDLSVIDTTAQQNSASEK